MDAVGEYVRTYVPTVTIFPKKQEFRDLEPLACGKGASRDARSQNSLPPLKLIYPGKSLHHLARGQKSETSRPARPPFRKLVALNREILASLER